MQRAAPAAPRRRGLEGHTESRAYEHADSTVLTNASSSTVRVPTVSGCPSTGLTGEEVGHGEASPLDLWDGVRSGSMAMCSVRSHTA